MSPPPAAAATLADLDSGIGLVARPTRMPPRPAAAPAAPVAAAATAPRERALFGIGLIILSTVFFSSTDVIAKMLTAQLPAIEVAWIRYAVFVAIVVPYAVAVRGTGALSTARPGLQILRALGMVGSSVLFIGGLRYLQVADATATNFIAPVFITALSVILLREKVGVRRWIATAVGLIGVLIVIRPGPDVFQSAALMPAGAALVWAFAAIATRIMAGSERPETTLVWSAVVGFVALSAAVPFVWETPTQPQIELGILIGVGSTIGHGILVIAFRHASASVLAPFSYTQLIWASIFGFMAFGALPTAWTLIGGAIVAASGLYIAHREHVRARDARRDAAA